MWEIQKHVKWLLHPGTTKPVGKFMILICYIPSPQHSMVQLEGNSQFQTLPERIREDWTLCTMIWYFRNLPEGGFLSCLNSNVDKKAFQIRDYWDQRWIFGIPHICLPKLLYSAQNKWEKTPKFHLLPGFKYAFILLFMWLPKGLISLSSDL